MDGISDERLAQLWQFIKGIVDANKAGVQQIPVVADAAESLAILGELIFHRKLGAVWNDTYDRLSLIPLNDPLRPKDS